MKRQISFLVFLFIGLNCRSQSWTASQLIEANTGNNITVLSAAEKEAIQYINLARLFPKLFISYELMPYTGPLNFPKSAGNSKYKKSLIAQLEKADAVSALDFDQGLYDYAKCFSSESGNKGTVGHKRKSCPAGSYAECCSYGMVTGKDIAMQWLIDENVSNLGHRINCLNADYSKIGISIHSHKKYGTCAVADLNW